MSFLRSASSSGVRPSGFAPTSRRVGGAAPAGEDGSCARLERKARFNMANTQTLHVFIRYSRARTIQFSGAGRIESSAEPMPTLTRFQPKPSDNQGAD